MHTVEVCCAKDRVVLAATGGEDGGWLFLDAIEERAS